MSLFDSSPSVFVHVKPSSPHPFPPQPLVPTLNVHPKGPRGWELPPSFSPEAEASRGPKDIRGSLGLVCTSGMLGTSAGSRGVREQGEGHRPNICSHPTTQAGPVNPGRAEVKSSRPVFLSTPFPGFKRVSRHIENAHV